MVQTTCPKCGVTFDTKAYTLAGGKRPFCSVACRRTRTLHACVTCGKSVWRTPGHLRGARVFCSRACALSTTFQRGFEPWNKDLKGIHLSPGSEFKPGHSSNKRVPVGTVTERKDQNGKLRAWVKIAQPNKWRQRASVAWELVNGPIPRGMVIHHHDRNPLNDSIDNLRCLTKSEHAKEHADNLVEARLARSSPSSR